MTEDVTPPKRKGGFVQMLLATLSLGFFVALITAIIGFCVLLYRWITKV